ncbi:antibiotic biosynthesis monooxygenase [Leucobacter albus]|uniref:Antibiotic biosynthesis monooxygenase n=1 Tax=Leucobacter albus TaxID=272210 RepID=A0ABW3TIJ4_9MICO
MEPLNISYELFVDHEDPGHFIFVEEWPDRAALDAHCATEHFTRLVPQIDAHQRARDTYIQMRRVFPAEG